MPPTGIRDTMRGMVGGIPETQGNRATNGVPQKPAPPTIARIVAGLDHSDEADDAVAFAQHLARSVGGKAVAVFCVSMDGVPPDEREAALQEESSELFNHLHARFGKTAIETLAVAEPSAPRGLAAAAADLDAGLIVLGSTRRGRFGRVVPGSVGERLLQGGERPVAVAPRGYARRRHIGIGLIGVAYQEGPEGAAALRQARAFAEALDAGVRIISVFDPRQFRDRYPDHLRAQRFAMQAELEAAATELDGIETETVLLDGDPAAWLAEQATSLDLLILGSRGYGPWERTLLGTVSGEVMRTAPCPVVTVPRPAEGAIAPGTDRRTPTKEE